MSSAADGSLVALRAALRAAAPALVGAIFDDIAEWLILHDPVRSQQNKSRDFNDPIWKIITLQGVLIAVADMRLMQRLRRVRQLGLAHLVYTGANHTRFEHSVGALHAASLMFDRVAETCNMARETAGQLRQVVCLAALLHDCGHTSFSHVGERVLTDIFYNEFTAISNAFDSAYADPFAASHSLPPRRKRPPAAELISALLTISPSMERVLTNYGLPYSAQTMLMMTCGLILGRPYNLTVDRDCFHFVKGIVSGDLDADKIDYVARDAFFAGIPTATDTNRLLSQLTAVRFDKDSRLATGGTDKIPSFKHGEPERYHLLGIKPSGASSLEMFVMTRAYLHERIYGHQKTRAAERLLERLLRQALMHLKSSEGWSEAQLFRLLFDPSGDDGLLARIALGLPNDDGSLATLSQRITDRRLPVRALAISQRTMTEFDSLEMRPKTSFLLPWNLAAQELASEPENLEDAICEVTGLEPGKDVIVDWPLANPVKERPDIWVKDPQDTDGPLYRVNHFFDVEQLSNAYRDVKQIGWIFSWPEHQAIVAAAAASQLTRRYDLLPGAEAFRRSKVSQLSLDQAKTLLIAKMVDGPDKDALSLFNVLTGKTIRPPPEIFSSLKRLLPGDQAAVSTRLAPQIAAAKIDRAYYDDLYVALEVFRILLEHCIAFNRHPIFRESVAPQNESRFQRHLKDFCEADDRCSKLFRVEEGTRKAGGITDLLFVPKEGGVHRTVVAELKSSLDPLSGLYDQHAGQPLQYSEASLGRFSLLYCQFADENAIAVPDTLEVRHNVAEGSPFAVFCLGQKAFWEVPSQLGSTSTL